MTETVYIETSILGYLTARRSRNLILMANAEITREWWDKRRCDFELYTSQAVVKEVSQGDTEMADQRQELLREFSFLELNSAVIDLAEQFLQ
jgi:hypothetical protein